MNETPHEAASALPSNSVTSRNAALSSHLLPTSITGICVISCPFNSLINAQIARNSSRLCFEHTEYTRIKAWPFVIDNRCIAGNWWLPVVSVICKVQMFLLQLMTCQKEKEKEHKHNKKTRVRKMKWNELLVDSLAILVLPLPPPLLSLPSPP